MSVEAFVQFWQEKNVNSAESRMAAAYRAATEAFAGVHLELLRLIRPKKTGSGWNAVFAPGAESLIPAFEQAEQEAASVAANIESFLKLTGGEFSLDRLAGEKIRLQQALDGIALAVKNTTAAEIRKGNAKTATEAELAPAVQEVLARQDRLQADLGPKLQDVKDRLSKARSILDRYS